MEFINHFKNDITISLGHTNADYNTSRNAFQSGANHVTHLYNAMPSFSHRSPGLIGAAVDSHNCTVELICDGKHIHESVIRSTFKLFTDDRIIFISDSIMATGMPDGIYSLGLQPVSVTGNLATLTDSTIAGSVTNLMDCLRIAVISMKIPLESAVKCSTINPAKKLGIWDKYGSITPGKIANIVLLDSNLTIQHIVFQGERLDIYS